MRRTVLIPIVALALVVGGCRAFFEPLQEGQEPSPDLASEAAEQPAADSRSAPVTTTIATRTPAPAAAQAEAANAAAREETAAAGAAADALSSDMLSPAEQLEAVDLALTSADVRPIVSTAVDRDTLVSASGVPDVAALASLAAQPNYRVIYAEHRSEKNADGRLAEVLLYRYDTAQAVLVQVDLGPGTARQLDVPGADVVPLVPTEIAEAAAVARAEEVVRQALLDEGLPEDAPANGVIVVGADPGDRCAEHRCMRLFFSDVVARMPAFSVVVDMADLQVVEVLRSGDEEVQP
jgi:hypothetical protein